MKQDFPLLKKQSKLVYLDNAATTQKPEACINAIKEFYETSNANAHRGLYKLSMDATSKLDWARKRIAKYIEVKPDEIIFTKGTTEGLNMLAIALEPEINSKHNIITTELEHHANFIPWQQLSKRKKAEFKVAKYNKEKNNFEDITKLVDKNTKIVAFTAMSNVTGQIIDIERISKKIKQKNPKTKIIIDGTQLLAHKKIDLSKTNIDFIAFSAHKLYGPLGTGFLHGKQEQLTKLRPFLYGGNMISKVTTKETTWDEPPYKFEAGTIDTAGIYAFAKTIEWLQKQDLNKLFKKEEQLKEYALKKLRKEGAKIFGHDISFQNEDRQIQTYGPVISFEIKNIHPHDLATIADKHNVCIRSGHHCCQPLMNSLKIPGTARISISFYNDKKDVDKLIEAIKDAKRLLK
ncbi:aminotransferase class V-fold PLP-dependent enzyme [Candidatus Woesearchaeota archaeon]|nr:aminotransferase class V-fold PLP-dependent enzyme [Candidatus Woesearchaeota archaeon]